MSPYLPIQSLTPHSFPRVSVSPNSSIPQSLTSLLHASPSLASFSGVGTPRSSHSRVR